MKKFSMLALVLVLGLAVSASAFDGRRQGFVLGGGIGVAPVASWKLVGLDESNVGVGLNFVIGYAWDDFNMIVYEGNVASYSSALLRDPVAQGFNGAAWYHYFGQSGRGSGRSGRGAGRSGKSMFSVAGIGFCVAQGDGWDNDPGLGLLGGFGYEFARHWQVGAYLSFGQTGAGYGYNMDHVTLNFLVSGVAF